MVPQRIFQTARVAARPYLAPLCLSLCLCAGSSAWAEDTSGEEAAQSFTRVDTIVLDLRPGSSETRRPSREAFVDGLSQYGEIRLTEDTELNALLARAPYSGALERGKSTLEAAAMSFGTLDCTSTSERAERAILDFAAATAAGLNADEELLQAYLYLFLCADRQAHYDAAMQAANMLRRLGGGEAPSAISLNTWQKYPQLDTQSNIKHHAVEFSSSPSGAELWIDFQKLASTPSTQLVSTGSHIVGVSKQGQSISQQVSVSGKGKLKLAIPKQESRWSGIGSTVEQTRSALGPKRGIHMLGLMAAVEAQVAFVLREPGRIAVWILPEDKPGAELVGHAPNAAIAGRLALEGLREAEQRPGIDPNYPLLREGDETQSTATSNRRWWIYGGVLGAAVIGAGFIVFQDLSEDRQRIEVQLP